MFGSINIDLVVQVPRLPQRGETVIGQQFLMAAGGKGANQAVAAAKLRVPVNLIGQVGDDHFGKILRSSLQTAGVKTEGVVTNSTTHSGVASIVVEPSGDNTISCAAGANDLVSREQVQRTVLSDGGVVLLELGIPLPAVEEAASQARSQGCRVILDPAPAPPDLPSGLYSLIDIITPNEVEASQLVGFAVDGPATAKRAAQVLHQRGVTTVIITLGRQGAFCSLPQEAFLVPAIPVEVVDTVAAGDAFNGGLAAALSLGKSLRQAVWWGTVAGALSVTKSGAQSSLPDWESFQVLLSSLNIDEAVTFAPATNTQLDDKEP